MEDKTPITTLEPPPEFHPEPTEPQETELESYRPATLQERFAAFFTDSLIFLYLLGGWALILQYFMKGNLASPLSFQRSGWILFGTTGVALHFLYYLFFEGVLTATPGKFLEGLAIQNKKGGIPSLFAILVRNLFRIVDYPLFFVAGVGLIEATKRRQRLGDLVAGTVVVRGLAAERRRIDPETARLGGATRRSLAFVLDLLLLIPFFYGLLLVIPAERPLVSMAALHLVPTITLFYLALSESLFQTTFGKALLGLKVVQEDGRRARFSSLLVRNSFRLFDMNLLGYLCAALSTLKQRPGDIAAGTIVVRDRRGLRGWLAVPAMLLLAASAAFLGFVNPESFLKKEMILRMGTYRLNPIPMALQRLTFKRLHLESLELGFNEEEVNKKGSFEPGSVVYLLGTISGYAIKNDRAWIQVDLQVHDSHRNLILDRMNVINTGLPTGDKKSARIATRFALHPEATPGRYEVTLILRDVFGNTKLQEKKSFWVYGRGQSGGVVPDEAIMTLIASAP
jgi:uncharacterized RDD family membrane protein YckC